MLKPTVFADHESLSIGAANCVAEALDQKPDALLCLAAGSSPQRAYQILVECRIPGLFDRVRIVKLDEWGGLPMNDPATCEQFFHNSIVNKLDLGDRYQGFDSNPGDPEAECRRIAGWLERNGPIDLCVLGLGLNGHVGFNEPASALQPHAHVAKLSNTSLKHPMLLQSGGRPAYGLTLGMLDLMHARRAMLLVSGETKRQPLRRLLEGPISTEFPASLLALHQNIALFVDSAALA